MFTINESENFKGELSLYWNDEEIVSVPRDMFSVIKNAEDGGFNIADICATGLCGALAEMPQFQITRNTHASIRETLLSYTES
jgi:hypothetical protein